MLQEATERAQEVAKGTKDHLEEDLLGRSQNVKA